MADRRGPSRGRREERETESDVSLPLPPRDEARTLQTAKKRARRLGVQDGDAGTLGSPGGHLRATLPLREGHWGKTSPRDAAARPRLGLRPDHVKSPTLPAWHEKRGSLLKEKTVI